MSLSHGGGGVTGELQLFAGADDEHRYGGTVGAAARQSADMIVMDGRIETIADGVAEGRATWASVCEALALLVGGNLGEILFTVGSSLVSATPPLNARQILFVNLVTDLLPAITVAARPPKHVTADGRAHGGPPGRRRPGPGRRGGGGRAGG